MRTSLFFLFLAFVLQASPAWAQRFGYIDSEYIVSKMPEFQKVNSEMDRWTQVRTKEIADKHAEIDKLERLYKSEEPLLTEPMKQQRRAEIERKENEVKELNNKVFGYNGQYHQRRKDVLKPIMDELSRAVEKVARQKQLRMILDKSSEGLAMIYTDPRDDYSDYVLEELGIDPKANPNQTNTPTQNTKTKQ
ncbi:OmpH family outer membrane protein [Siphonobacter sp.]|uniref:OmpH family outer membrane protein n=1 Tax=Siphonobacter sp. TaxID=1869184 RepID=UPI003B3BE382